MPIETAAVEAPNPQVSETQATSPEQGGAFDLMLSQLMQAIMTVPVQAQLPAADQAVQAEDSLAGALPAEGSLEEEAAMPLPDTLEKIQSAFVAVIAEVLKGAAAPEETLPGSAISQEQAALQNALSSLISAKTDATEDEGNAPELFASPNGKEAKISIQKTAESVQMPVEAVKKAPVIEAPQPQILQNIILSEGSSKDMADLPELQARREKNSLPETLPISSFGPQGTIRMHPESAEGPVALVRPRQFSETMHMEGHRFMITRLDGTSIEISLQPEGMGKLDIGLLLDKGVVNAQIQASSAAGKELIEKHMQNIVSALAQEGITIGGFSVSLKDDRNDFAWSQGKSETHQIQGESALTNEYISTPRQYINPGVVSIFV